MWVHHHGIPEIYFNIYNLNYFQKVAETACNKATCKPRYFKSEELETLERKGG